MNPGDALPPFRVERVTAQSMREWALFLHDPNPIHLDVAAVRARGLGNRLINQGPANVAYVMNMLLAAFPGGRIARLESRFVDNVYAQDAVVAGGTITAVTDEGVACDIWLDAEGRGRAITGTALMLPAGG